MEVYGGFLLKENTTSKDYEIGKDNTLSKVKEDTLHLLVSYTISESVPLKFILKVKNNGRP